jgi:hypothetical protein
MSELIAIINSFENNYIFRGQANAIWELESSLERLLRTKWSSDAVEKYEEYSVFQFKSKFHIYGGSSIDVDDNKLSWLSVMQHYGLPTRLLDFSLSPYIALYFALEDYDFSEKNDFSLFCIDYSKVEDINNSIIKSRDGDFDINKYLRKDNSRDYDRMFTDIFDRFSMEILGIAEPNKQNTRMDRQSGTFIFSGSKSKKIKDIFSLDIYKDVDFLKIIIPGKLAENVFALLRKVNINPKTIYGDLYGMAKLIKINMMIYTK